MLSDKRRVLLVLNGVGLLISAALSGWLSSFLAHWTYGRSSPTSRWRLAVTGGPGIWRILKASPTA
jgi:hypothetical protein